MRTWIKNGARMTILVTAFAGAGAGVAYSQMQAGSPLAARSGAGQAVAHLVVMHGTCPVDGCAALGVDQATDSPYAGGPLASYSFVGMPGTSYGTAAEDQNDATPVLGKDMPEESTNPAAIYRSEESPGAGTSTGPGSGTGSGTGSGSTGKGHHHGGSGGSGAGKGTGKGHHGTGTGKGHHGSGGSGAGAGKSHHGMGSGSKSGHHAAGGTGASSGATSAGESSAADENSATDNNVASDEMAENGASAASGSNSAASQQSTLPTTGAPLAGLLGLAVLAVGAGVFLRLRSKRDDEDQPEES
jgi:LPXTG cell wall anchor motif